MKKIKLSNLKDGTRFKIIGSGFTGKLLKKSMGTAWVQFDEQEGLESVIPLSSTRKTYVALGTEVIELEDKK